MTNHFAGFDIGGTKTLAVLMADDHTVVHELRMPRPRGPEATIAQILGLLDELETLSGTPVEGAGIGIAGAISRAGSVQFSPNIAELVDFPLAEQLAERTDVPIVVDNDANTAAWAEHRGGAGRGVDHLLYVALGTGIGAGIVCDGRIFRGAHGFAGEVGHIVIDRHGDTHVSGVRGPWEMYASGSGLAALARRWAAVGDLPSVLGQVDDVESIRGEHVGAAVAAGADDALALLDEFAAHAAIGLTNLLYVLDPAVVVIGGGLVDLGEPLRVRVQNAVDRTTLGGDFREPVPIRLAELGVRAGALGAAMLAADDARSR